MPFDEKKADHIIAFFKELLTHTKAKWAGMPFQVLPWQEELLRETFGRVKKDGNRQYRIVYLELPKKNGKTECLSGIALKQLVADGEASAEVYSAAGDREQASLVFNVAAQMVRNSPTLNERIKIVDSRKRMIDFQTGSYYQVLSSESYTKHGISPSCILVDELHAQPDRRLWDVLIEGTDAARQQQLVFVATTAGIFDQHSIAWEIHDYALKVRDGVIKDPTFLPIIYSVEEDEDWEDPKVWERVNPSLDQIFNLDHIRTHYDQAVQTPSRLNNFLRFRLNKWVAQISRWMPMDKWDLCNDEINLEDLNGRTCCGALDLSSSIDMTAFCLVFVPGEGEKWITTVKFYMPLDNMQERIKTDRVPYDSWVRMGLVTATPGNVIDYEYIRQDILKAIKDYDLREIAYDPWGAVQFAVQLQDQDGIEMVEFRQGFKSMSGPMKELYKLVISQELTHGMNPVLRWNADNIMVKTDPAENLKPEKAKSTGRIDGLVALVMALDRAMRLTQQPEMRMPIFI